MSYRQEVDALGHHLAAALAHPGPLAGTDLDAAVVGYTATTQLLCQVHADLVGTGPRGPRDLAALEREPIPLLGRLLRDLPQLQQVAMTDVQARPAASPPGAHWRAVARCATLAHHAWATAPPAGRPRGPAALAEIAHLARLTETLAALSPALARDLRTAGRQPEAARLLARTTSGLRVTAFTVRATLRTAAAPGRMDLVPAVPKLVLVVRRPAQLPDGLRRLSALLDGAGHLTPQHLQLIAHATAAATHLAADTLRRGGHPDAAVALTRHGDLLAQVAGAGRQAASILPADPLPLAQAQHVHLAVAVLRRASPLTQQDAWRIAVAVPAVGAALDTAARREVDRRRWLVPSRSTRPDAPAWTTPRRAAALPFTEQLAAVARDGTRLRDTLGPATPKVTAAATDRARASRPSVPVPARSTTRRVAGSPRRRG